jgi:hypothetical protein
MYSEYDVVIANKNLENVPKGSQGTVLIVHKSGKDYVVEFMDDEGNTINVLTVNERDIDRYRKIE